ncbi:MAG TPA: helix-turn-helix domain-containing protein [Chloroflexota bacterium]
MPTKPASAELDVNPTEWYSVNNAARILGVRPVRVRQLLAYGELKGEKIGRSWNIRGHDIQRWHAQRKPIGRPKGSVSYKLDVLGRRRKVNHPRPVSRLKEMREALRAVS